MKYDFSKEGDQTKAKIRFDYLIKNQKHVELKEVRRIRSISQNSYLHVVITLYAIHFGSTINEAKTDLKRECDFMVYEKGEKKYLRETRLMNSKELTQFIDWIRNYASLNGCYIPTSEEYVDNKYSIDKDMDLHKQYL